ncbi:DUF4259 domain-containing protein [Kitasatospora paranensis]|uniref:DUF4259 domain-containing protein n=1 Tax=Kitasatospora paranensis TaxID=258053 RepID=A0ABW2FMC9_9ACTN
MGTWDIGPFDNDTAAVFAFTLDETDPDEREGLVRTTLLRAIRHHEYLDGTGGVEAVAAAALIAAQHPGGDPVSTIFGPKEALPTFAADLHPLAVEALDRVLTTNSELAELWDDAVEGLQWRRSIRRLRAALDPEPEPQAEVLFDI